jgi:hypothetical protein
MAEIEDVAISERVVDTNQLACRKVSQHKEMLSQPVHPADRLAVKVARCTEH